MMPILRTVLSKRLNTVVGHFSVKVLETRTATSTRKLFYRYQVKKRFLSALNIPNIYKGHQAVLYQIFC